MAAAEQLCLDVSTSEPDQVTGAEMDLVDAVLDAHGGDYRAALQSLLLDADFLRDQLYTASYLISKGMSRGWRPRYERV
jgi:hypothetical protein